MNNSINSIDNPLEIACLYPLSLNFDTLTYPHPPYTPMLSEITHAFNTPLQTFSTLLLIINALLHLLFAGAIAKDAGQLYQLGQRPALVSAATWAFATLLGGVLTAAIYWFIHHSTLTRVGYQEKQVSK